MLDSKAREIYDNFGFGDITVIIKSEENAVEFGRFLISKGINFEFNWDENTRRFYLVKIVDEGLTLSIYNCADTILDWVLKGEETYLCGDETLTP